MSENRKHIVYQKCYFSTLNLHAIINNVTFRFYGRQNRANYYNLKEKKHQMRKCILDILILSIKYINAELKLQFESHTCFNSI